MTHPLTADRELLLKLLAEVDEIDGPICVLNGTLENALEAEQRIQEEARSRNDLSPAELLAGIGTVGIMSPDLRPLIAAEEDPKRWAQWHPFRYLPSEEAAAMVAESLRIGQQTELALREVRALAEAEAQAPDEAARLRAHLASRAAVADLARLRQPLGKIAHRLLA